MKIRINFDNTMIKIGDGKVRSSPNRKAPGEPAYFEMNLNFLYNIFKFFPLPAVSDNRSKYAYLNAQTYEDAAGIPRLLPASGHDMYNYVARYGAANFQIQAVMKLDGRLDPEKLKKAVRLSLDVEPIFGCRFVENDPPYWQRLEYLDQIEFCSFEKTNNLNNSVYAFLDSPFSMDNDTKIKLRLISDDSYDTLCLKINHTCCDATGTKEYLQLLSDIYTAIDQTGEYVPKPNVRNRRDQDRLFENLGIKDPESAWIPDMEIPEVLWKFPWKQGLPVNMRTIVCKFPQGHLDVLSSYGKARGASINDLLLTALYRAMFEFSQPEYNIPMHIGTTVDLRRYLPDNKTQAIRNFSGGIDTQIARLPNESFDGTLSRIVPMMDEVKNGRPGLLSAVGLERVEKSDFYGTMTYYRDAGKNLTYTNEFSPVLSNMSYISKSPFRFGKATVTDAYIVPPALSAPGLLLCVSTYNGILTITACYYETQANRQDMEEFIDMIKQELLELQ